MNHTTSSTIKEKSLLFKADMAMAVVGGYKTQTRRLVQGMHPDALYLGVEPDGMHRFEHELIKSPYGAPGQRIWGRETFYAWGRWVTQFSAKKGRDEWHFVDDTLASGRAYQYAAGQPDLGADTLRGGAYPSWWKRPAIFMPRQASRIALQVTSVRVERLQAISQADAIAEGLTRVVGPLNQTMWEGAGSYGQFADPRVAYRFLWEEINGPGSWDTNPLVWVISFGVAS